MNALARAFSSQPVSYKKAPNDLGVFYGDPGAIVNRLEPIYPAAGAFGPSQAMSTA